MKHVLLAVASVFLLLLALPAAAAPAAANEPLLWPEEQRSFWQDGPALLLTQEQRAAFLALDEPGRTAFIRDFLAGDTLREGIARRRRLAALETDSPLDVRAQLLFLQGVPVSREIITCGIFKPLEVWTYGTLPDKVRELVLYQPLVSEPFRLWRPIDSKKALYTTEALRWVQDFDEMRMRGKRIDRYFCPESKKVDEATGIVGLRGTVIASRDRIEPDGTVDPSKGKDYYWSNPKDRSDLLGPPADLAAWARAAAATRLPADVQSLQDVSLDFDFPSRAGQRLVARGLVGVPSGDKNLTVVEVDGKPRIRLRVEGVVELGSQVFERFRVRYRVPAPAPMESPATAATPIPLVFEKALRPGQRFLLRLRVVEEGSNAQALLTRSLEVPRDPVSRLGAQVAGAMAGETLPPGIASRDSLLLLPPLGEVMIGTWRAEALVTGERIQKVIFKVDGEPQLSRTLPPYSAEVRLDPFPREQVVRAEGYDADGSLVAADQVVLNQAKGVFRVTIEEPRRGTRPTGRVLARADVVVPEEQKVDFVELKVNDTVVARLTEPPWQTQIEVPPGEETSWLTATAHLEDGTQTEDVRFLRAPANLEEMDVDLVELYVSVTDSSGRFLRDLEAKDFKVLEDGKPQALTRFELVETFPITLGFIIDTSASMADALAESQRAAEQLLAHLMTPRDRAFAVGFSQFPYVVISPTDDAEGVAQALEGLTAMGRTALYDALITGLFYFRNTKGQRAMILLTDGDDTGSSSSWEQALEYTRRSGVVVYPIGLGVGVLSMGARGKLEEIAQATGGRPFFIQQAEELGGVYSQIEEELRSRYYLAYNSNRKEDATGFRPVEVQSRKGRARTARGYYP